MAGVGHPGIAVRLIGPPSFGPLRPEPPARAGAGPARLVTVPSRWGAHVTVLPYTVATVTIGRAGESAVTKRRGQWGSG